MEIIKIAHVFKYNMFVQETVYNCSRQQFIHLIIIPKEKNRCNCNTRTKGN